MRYAEIAVYEKDGQLMSFRDYEVHKVLLNSNIKRKPPNNSTGREWFKTDLETVIKAIKAVKQGKKNLSGVTLDDEKFVPIILRPEQEDAVSLAVKHFKKKNRMLWNAKMRFGKTLSALEVVKRIGFSKTIIVTHRPVVNENWLEDFKKIFNGDENYIYGSKGKGYSLDQLLKSKKNFVYFASMQDLRGSEKVGGKFSKNAAVFNTEWDLVIVDEAHEGTTTALGDSVIKNVVREFFRTNKD